jgi:hypothetical protein
MILGYLKISISVCKSLSPILPVIAGVARPISTLFSIRWPSPKMTPCYSSLRYGEWGMKIQKVVLSDAGLSCRRMSLSCEIPALGLGFVGSIVLFPCHTARLASLLQRPPGLPLGGDLQLELQTVS